MNKKGIVMLCILFLISLATSACASKPIPGIDEPIVVRGVDMLFFEAETMRNIRFGTNTVAPDSPYNRLIAFKAYSDTLEVNDPCKWRNAEMGIVTLEYLKDGEKGKVEYGVCQANWAGADGWIRFFFATYQEGVTDYMIVFPDGRKVPLDGLIN